MTPPEDLATCEPTLRWAAAVAQEERWYQSTMAQDAEQMFRAVLPRPLREAADAARLRGEVPAADGLLLLMAPLLWATRALPWAWTPLGPWPSLLAWLAEIEGVDGALHEADSERLARLAAWLPHWRLRRGELAAALQLWQEVRDEVLHAIGPESSRAAPAPEVLTCRTLEWWAERATEPPPMARIEQGLALLHVEDEDWLPLAPGDIAVPLDQGVPPAFARLMPVWCAPRLLAPRGGVP